MAKLTDAGVAALVDPANYATISTVNEDGSLTSSIIWFNVEDDQVCINGAEGRRWPANLDRDGRIAVVISAPDNPYDYVEVRATARRVEDTDEADAHINRLAKRYIDKDEYPFRAPGEVRVKFALDATTIRHQKQG